MNKVLSLFTSLIVMFVIMLGSYTTGQAAPQMALMPSRTINIAHFYKPPNMDPSTAAKTFGMIVLTNGDESYRKQLEASGFSSTIPEYFRSEAIQNPGSCTATPLNNQVAYKPGDFCYITANHPDWFLFDSSGRRILVKDSPSYYRMDPSNPGWRAFFLSRVLESQNQHGWSGLFLDNVEASLGKFYGTQVPKYPNDQSYQDAVAGFLQYLHANYAQKYGRPIIGNVVTLPDYGVWFKYLQSLDGGLLERFAVNWHEEEYLSDSKWQEDLAALEKTQADGKYAILVAPGYQSDQNRETFAFASYLLISNGKVAFRYANFSSYRETWLYDNYKLNLGTPRGARYRSGNLWRRDFTNGFVTVDPVNHKAAISTAPDKDMAVSLGDQEVGAYNVPSTDVVTAAYAGVMGGPVKITSRDHNKFFASERTTYGNSFNEVMGYPTNQLTTDYWFPWYDNMSMATWILVGNPSTSSATVEIYIGGTKKGPYTIPAGGSITPRFNLPASGPVRVISTNRVKIFTSERVSYNGVFNEVMGYSASQFTTDYWYPWYDNQTMSTWILVGNPSTSSARVDIYIGGVKRQSYTILPGKQITPRFNLMAGPVRVVSTNGVKIFTSERTQTNESFNEMMGYPSGQLTTEYWFPWYDSNSMSTWVLVGNPSSQPANVVIEIGSMRKSYTIPAGGRITPRFSGVMDGPVRVLSTNGQKIFASERTTYGNSFNEVMGYPSSQLTTEYWFPWYDNKSMSTWVLISRP